jgi:hypothetical protein
MHNEVETLTDHPSKSDRAIRLSQSIRAVIDEGENLGLLSQTMTVRLIRLLGKTATLLGGLAADE